MSEQDIQRAAEQRRRLTKKLCAAIERVRAAGRKTPRIPESWWLGLIWLIIIGLSAVCFVLAVWIAVGLGWWMGEL